MLDISLFLMLFVAALFLGLVYVLNDMLYKPLLAFMDKRERSISDDMASSDQNTNEIDELLSGANDKISEAKSEAAGIKEKATSGAKQKAEEILEDGKKDIEAQYEEFVGQLAKQRDDLSNSIAANVTSYQDGIKSKIKNI